jgi:hypothetical protein
MGGSAEVAPLANRVGRSPVFIRRVGALLTSRRAVSAADASALDGLVDGVVRAVTAVEACDSEPSAVAEDSAGRGVVRGGEMGLGMRVGGGEAGGAEGKDAAAGEAVAGGVE